MPTDDRLLARQLLNLLPLVMRTMAADMRRQGCLLPPTHFALPGMLALRPRTMGELAERMGVSAPTMSNLIATLAERGRTSLQAHLHLIQVNPANTKRFRMVIDCLRQEVAARDAQSPEPNPKPHPEK